MTTMKDAFDDISRLECFGFSPASSSTKPAHVANGWFRRLTGRRYDPVLLNQTVVHWVKDREEHPSDRLLDSSPSVFEAFRPASKRTEFSHFRADLRQLVSPAGGAVNKGNRHSSYNITHEAHLTDDYNDRFTGAFLYHLVATDLGAGESPIADLIRRTLSDPSDEISTLTWPLVRAVPPVDVTIGSFEADSVFKRRAGKFLSPTLRNLRTGFDNLALFEESYGGGIDALRRCVAFGVFSLLCYMANRLSELSGASGLCPMLLYAPERVRTTAYQASHGTYNLVRRQIESLYTERLRSWLEARIGVRPQTKRCEKFIEELEFGKDDAARRAQLLRAYRSLAGEMASLDAMAEALRETVFRSLSATPLEFFRQLGVKSGFVRPSGNNAVRKYFTVEGVLLESLLASVLPSGQLPFRRFLDELYVRYGLITGGRAEDAQILANHGIGAATVEDLHRNSQVFRQQLISLGWARQFADGVLVVHVPEALR